MWFCLYVLWDFSSLAWMHTAAYLPAKLILHVKSIRSKKWMQCMSICVLLLDKEKRFLRDTGREKSKQLEKENGEGGEKERESEQQRAVWMWLMRSLQGRPCHCNSLRREQKEKKNETKTEKSTQRKTGMQWKRQKMRGDSRLTDQAAFNSPREGMRHGDGHNRGESESERLRGKKQI